MMKTDEPSANNGPPIGIILEIDTPTETGAVQQTVPLDATVGATTTRVMASLGVDAPNAYEMWVAVESTNRQTKPYEDRSGGVEWSRLDADSTLLDSLRGAQRRPKIAPKPEDPSDTPEGNSA